jgi:hypothetical protein
MRAIIGIVVFILLMIGLTFIYADADSNVPYTTINSDDVRIVFDVDHQKDYENIIHNYSNNLEVKILIREFEECIYLLRHDNKMTTRQKLEIKTEAHQKLRRAEKICNDQKENKLQLLREKYLGK